MAIKYSVLFLSLLVSVMVVSQVEAQLEPIIGLIRVRGTVFCAINGSINGTATPVFPNALVQLKCGNGTMVASATTNLSGLFSILLDPLQFLLSFLLSSCNLIVNTPLSSCNVSLPSTGSLQSPLQLIRNTVVGLLNITDIGPVGFQLIP